MVAVPFPLGDLIASFRLPWASILVRPVAVVRYSSADAVYFAVNMEALLVMWWGDPLSRNHMSESLDMVLVVREA